MTVFSEECKIIPTFAANLLLPYRTSTIRIMKRLLFSLLILVATGGITALCAQQTVPARETVARTARTHIQSRTERLEKALAAGDHERAARYERDLSAAMREALQEEKGKNAAKMEQIINQFDGFSFVNAAKAVREQHLVLLREFATLLP